MIEQIGASRAADRSVFVGNRTTWSRTVRRRPARHPRLGTAELTGSPATCPVSKPDTFADRDAIRAELGYRAGEQVCVVTVGGSGVGTHLLRRVVAAYPAAKALVPGLRLVVVTGPRIEPDLAYSAAGGRRPRGARLRTRPVPAPGSVRPSRGAGAD